GAPATGDDVTINGGVVLTYDVTSNPPLLNSLTLNAPSSGSIGTFLSIGSNTLNVNNSATSTITIAGSGPGNAGITIAGGTINAGGSSGGGISIAASDSLSGFGTINISASGTISGSGTITAQGNGTGSGTLDLVGTVSSGLSFTIGTSSASNLKFDGTATSGA